MAKIGFWPLNQYSHIKATFSLARKLADRGHHIVYFVPADCLEQVKRNRFEAVVNCSSIAPRGLNERIKQNPQLQKRFLDDLVELLTGTGLEDELKGEHLDLLIVDSYIREVALAAHREHIPVLLLNPTLPHDRQPNSPPQNQLIVPNTPLDKWRIWFSWFRFDLYRNWSRILGRPQPSNVARLIRLATKLGYSVQDLDLEGPIPRIPFIPELILCDLNYELPKLINRSNVHYIGDYVDSSTHEKTPFPWSRLDHRKKLVYCALGTLSFRYPQAVSFLQKVVDAMEHLDHVQLVVSTGNAILVDKIQTKRPDFVVVSHAPQLDLLNETSVFITHGGLNSVKESIRSGVPMVVFPWHRVMSPAIRVSYHRMGLCGDPDRMSVSDIRAMVVRLLDDPSYRRNTQRMARRFSESMQRDPGVKWIEHYLARGSRGRPALRKMGIGS